MFKRGTNGFRSIDNILNVREMKVLMYSQLLCNMICVVFDGTRKETCLAYRVPEVFC